MDFWVLVFILVIMRIKFFDEHEWKICMYVCMYVYDRSPPFFTLTTDFFPSGRGQFPNPATGARPPFALGEVPASVAEPAEGLVLCLGLGGLLERDQRLDAAGFFAFLGVVGYGALIAVVVVDLRSGVLATCGDSGACARTAASWRGRRRGSKGGVASFGAARVAAEKVGWVDESADVAGPGAVVEFGRTGGEVDDRGWKCRFRRFRYRRRILGHYLCC